MLKTLSELRSMPIQEIPVYATFLINNHGWSMLDATTLLSALQQAPEEALPIPDTLLLHLCQFFIDNYNYWNENEEETQINCSTEGRTFTSDNVVVFNWMIDGRSHSVVVDTHTADFLSEFTERLAEDKGIIDLYESRFGEAIQFPPQLNTLSTDLIEYMRWLDIVSTPEYLEPNSESLEVKENTARFSGAMWYEAIQQKIITLAGVGGIGSYVGFMLARMNPKSIFVYDDDRVEAVNMSGQFYGRSDIGNYKADALASAVRNYSDYNSIFSVTQRFTQETSASDIMICGFDNMEARKLFFDKWLAHIDSRPVEERKHCLFIDGRLAAEDLQVLCITGDNYPGIEKYKQEFLFTDEEADETVCSYKQTTYMANMIGSIIVNLFTNFVANELVGAPIRSLPFFTAYDGISMRIKNE